jgi:hypothetical protein
MAYKDNRDWTLYNEKLVKRGEFYLSLEFIDSWDEELERMNKGKRGKPFEYPETFIHFSALWYHFFHLPYRQLEGALRHLSKFIPKLKAADYSTLWHRITKLVIELSANSREVIVAVDSTGIKVTNRGEWMRRKWWRKERKGWIKVHIAVNVKTKKLLAIEVTDERVTDHEMLEPLLKDVDMKDALLDGAYDTEDAFEFFKRKGVDPPGIKIRKNASQKGLSERAFAVREFQKLGYEKWKKKHGYGGRWTAEGVFSAVKRCFGETVRATSVEGMMLEVRRKFLLYNMLLNL